MRALLLVAVLVAVAALAPAHTCAAPYGWPEGWSGAVVLARASRFARGFAAELAPDGSIHLAWLEDHAGGVGLRYGCLQPAAAGLEWACWVWREDGRVQEVALALAERSVHLLFTAVQNGRTMLGHAVVRAPDAPPEVRILRETDLSMASPRLFVHEERLAAVWCESSRGLMVPMLLHLTGDLSPTPLLEELTHPCTMAQVLHSPQLEWWLLWSCRLVSRYQAIWARPLQGGSPHTVVEYWAAETTAGFSAVPDTRSGHLWVAFAGQPADGRSAPAGLYVARIGGDDSPAELSCLQEGTCYHPRLTAGPDSSGPVLAWMRVEGRERKMQCYWMVLDGEHQPVCLTRQLGGCWHPVAFISPDGHGHFLALRLQPDGSQDLVYMHTLDPAPITRWNLVGLKEENLWMGIPLRAVTLLATAVVQLLMNAGTVLAALLVVWVLTRARVLSSEPPLGAVVVAVAASVILLRLAAPRALVSLFPRASGLTDDLVAAALATALSLALWGWRRPGGRAHDILRYTAVAVVWVFWYLLFGLVRTAPW